MPRDLQLEKGNVWKGLAQLQTSPEEVTQSYEDLPDMSAKAVTPAARDAGRGEAIKPYVQALTPLDLDSCVKLEEVTFPPEERCSREKFDYRFTKCGELSLGIFTSADTTLANPPPSHPSSASTAATSVPVYSPTPDRKSILLGHIIASKTDNLYVRDEDMEVPHDWRAEHERGMNAPSEASASRESQQTTQSTTGSTVLGHKDDGRTLCVHSFAIVPEFQNRGLGRLLFRSYIQRMQGSGVADRLAIITHPALVEFYQGLGFERRGESPVKFGNGGWIDMVCDLRGKEE